ncbi:hypothetical protein GZH47_02635 [Paenibacillus rhizovicinus]|uniref:BIG2 domain-containing protein n=1 Tax=Paenibacillus rhizovicinus TaxID=2704463 RepID=A0A6C0NUI5_9BACL|nr:sugar-binding protein [Paenibacillus rhizovicinus]QHW29837.1 hypothetical protein GZH47_02635 [Paenibacillus rhizovicinus]
MRKVKKGFAALLSLTLIAGTFAAVAGNERAYAAAGSNAGPVDITLGSAYVENGISAWAGDGGSVNKVTYDGQEGWETNPASGNHYIYLNVSDDFINGGTNHVNVSFEYYDSGLIGEGFGFSYNSTGTAWDYNVPKTILTGSNTWKTVTYTLSDAQFANMENGADIRLDTNVPIAIHKVTVETAAEPSEPTAISVDPAEVTMNAQSVQQVSATVRDQNNSVMNKRNVNWTSSTPAVATVDGSGTITAVSTGSTTVTASYNGLSAAIPVTINNGPISAVLGATNINRGISVWPGDGPGATAVTYDGISGLQTNPATGAFGIYGNVSDKYIYDGKHKVTVTINYYDALLDGKQSFSLLYDSVLYNWSGGPNTTTYLTGTNTWKSVTYTLDDVKFAGRENNGADFRINTSAPIAFHSITMEKFPILTIEGSSAKTGNIFKSDESPTINLSFGNQFDTSEDLNVDYSVLDYSSSIVKSGQFDVNLEPNEPGFIKPLSFGTLPKGTYTLSVHAGTPDGSTQLNESYYFSVIADLTGKSVAPFLGMNSHYSISWSNVDLGLPLIVQSGATNIRDAHADVSDKAAAYGINMLTGLSLSGFSQAAAGSEQYYADFSSYAKTYATSMIGKAEYMEVGNEYNSGGSAAEYFKFLKLAYAAVKSVAPDMKVVAGVAFQYDANWLKQLIDLGACDYADAISFHVYSNNNPENEGLVGNFQDLRDYIQGKGITKNIDLLLTETGYATQETGYGGLPESTSAAYAAQLYVTTLANNDLIKKIYWYDFMNDGTDPTFYETNGGIVRSDLTAKPSFVAFNAASDLLAGAAFVESYNTLDSNIRIYKFHQAAANKDILVLWANKNSQAINLNLGGSPLSVADLFGNQQQYDTIGGAVTLTASEQPIYIEGSFAQAPTLGSTPAFSADTPKISVAPGDAASIHITRTAGAENLSGTYAVELPAGWELTSGGQFGAGQTTDTLTFTAPETTDHATGEIRIYPTSESGNLYAKLKVETQMSEPSKVEMSPQVNDAGTGYDLSVKITNLSNKGTLSGGTVTILQPESMAGSAAFDTIAPNSVGEVRFDAPTLDIYAPTNVKLRIDRNDGSSQVIERNLTSLTSVKAEAPIDIDGVIDAGEWNHAQSFQLNDASQVKLMTDWGGTDDLSATAYTKWDANYLYLAVSVTDNTDYNPYAPGLSWQGDGIQFTIDPGRAQGPGTIKSSENGFALNTDTGVIMKSGGYGAGNLENSLAEIKRDGNRTNYELAIKWTDILPAGMTAASGTNVGFSFLVNDNDGAGRRGWMEYMSGIGFSKDPNLYGDLILTDRTSLGEDTPPSQPPVTNAAAVPAQPDGQNGWYVHPVMLNLTPDSDAAKTEYSLDGGSTWLPYAAPVTFDQDGSYTVTYRSTNAAGQTEEPKTLAFKLDQTAPAGAIQYSSTDSTSGPVVAALTANEPVTVTNNGGSDKYSFSSNGSFTFEFIDAAGNAGTAVAEVNNIVTKSKAAPGEPVLSNDNGYDTGLLDGDYKVTMNVWYGNNGNTYKLYENDVLIDTQTLTDNSPQAQSAATSISGRKNGTYTYYVELSNSFGTTRSKAMTVTVKDAAPGKPVLSNDNWDGDGSFNVSMNMYWGTNGSAYRLYENDVLIDEQSLAAHTPQAQSAVTAISGRAVGVYTYRCELVNDAGAASSVTMQVTVKK